MVHKQEDDFLSAYDEYAGAIFRYTYLRIYDRSEARDVVQEVFLRAWKYVSEKKEIREMRPFLYKIATNLIINKNQKKKATSLDALMEEGFDPGFDDREKNTNFIDGLKAMEKLDELDSKYREVVYLRFVEDLEPREIAEIVDESVNVVSVRIHRGVEKLKEIIGNNN